eukprot:m.76130 g.76130  ORF g.76130 m.76130 type:complete len:183 (+) comp12544_c0_seq3:144-692(+)
MADDGWHEVKGDGKAVAEKKKRRTKKKGESSEETQASLAAREKAGVLEIKRKVEKTTFQKAEEMAERKRLNRLKQKEEERKRIQEAAKELTRQKDRERERLINKELSKKKGKSKQPKKNDGPNLVDSLSKLEFGVMDQLISDRKERYPGKPLEWLKVGNCVDLASDYLVFRTRLSQKKCKSN